MSSAHVQHELVVFGILNDATAVDQVVKDLRTEGFRGVDVWLFGDCPPMRSRGPEGAVIGVGIGSVVGALLGWLAGIGVLALPGVEPRELFGPILTLITGAGLGAMGGCLIGVVLGLAINDASRSPYEGIVRIGHGSVVAVRCPDSEWADKAESVLQSAGAIEIASGQRGSRAVSHDEDFHSEVAATRMAS